MEKYSGFGEVKHEPLLLGLILLVLALLPEWLIVAARFVPSQMEFPMDCRLISPESRLSSISHAWTYWSTLKHG